MYTSSYSCTAVLASSINYEYEYRYEYSCTAVPTTAVVR